MTMPRAESFTVTKARGKRFTERYREKTVLHDNPTKKRRVFYTTVSPGKCSA